MEYKVFWWQETKEQFDDIVESDIELDNADVVEPDSDPPQQVNWFLPSFFVTAENSDPASEWCDGADCRWEIHQLKWQKRCRMLRS